MEDTAGNTGLSLQVAINYGARLKLLTLCVKSLQRLPLAKLVQKISVKEMISNHLYTSGMPDPGLLIRTGGEMRLSNYLLWQSAYTEIFVTPGNFVVLLLKNVPKELKRPSQCSKTTKAGPSSGTPKNLRAWPTRPAANPGLRF